MTTTTSTKTPTKAEMFKSIREAVASNPEMVAFIDHELELLSKRSASPRKPTKTQIENEGYKAAILSYLADEGEPRTVKSIVETIEELGVLSNQRVTSLLTALRKEGKIKRTAVKKVPYYEIGVEEGYAGTEEEEG